jgi:SAM-dependent methyltransferase
VPALTISGRRPASRRSNTIADGKVRGFAELAKSAQFRYFNARQFRTGLVEPTGARDATFDRSVPDAADLEEGLSMAGLEAHYSARGIEARILAALRAAGLNPEQRLSPDELGALDHFHTGGLRASRELIDLARIRSEDRVLDIGAGLAGPARLLASSVGCRVNCVELSPDYCAGAVLLNRLTGLDDRIAVHEGSALDLPFADDSFDVAWMQNVGMNIADKRGLYAEVCRVLRPQGRFAFQEIAAGEPATTYFPLPWATDPADSFLVSADAIRLMLGESGFVVESFEDVSDAHLSRTSEGAAQERLSLAVFVDNLAQKAGNARRSLEEGRIRLVRGVFRVES